MNGGGLLGLFLQKRFQVCRSASKEQENQVGMEANISLNLLESELRFRSSLTEIGFPFRAICA